MRSRALISFALLAGVAFVGSWIAVGRFSLSALDEPGAVETGVATRAKRWLVARDARGPFPAKAPNDATSAAIGNMQFGVRCAPCHGADGRSPTDIGRWMYPRAADLASPGVQAYSDEQLFWIVKHGIRLTGMPGFGKSMPEEQIWHLVNYVRRIGASASKS
ncbi:MAG: cytochrome c [Acidobacteria bacterium]|nr:cytochrome c [Acidobacteriota bacterium]